MSIRKIELGFVAALEREVCEIVRLWSRTDLQIGASKRTVYYNERAVLICAGTGILRARDAANVLIENWAPGMVISIGFAGSCVGGLQPGALVVPASLMELGTGTMFPCAFGSGRLITADRVAGKSLKNEIHARYEALAVDMEATGVATAAREANCEFAAIKAISDGVEEDLGFLSGFVRPHGFATGRFVAHVALRPRLWPAVAALSKNSQLASSSLASAVTECVADRRSFSAKYSPSAEQVRLEESC